MGEEASPENLRGQRKLVGPQTAAGSMRQHDRLWLAAICRPLDFEPYGLRVRDGNDCSCGCLYFAPLEGEAGSDWGVCTNPLSHRCGLLTFEHMGCPHFELDERLTDEDDDHATT